MITYKQRKTIKPDEGFGAFGPSQTVPDMALPLKTLLERYVRGQDVATFKTEYETEEEAENFPDISKMDKLERIDALRNVAGQQLELRAQLAREASQKAEKEANDALEAKAEQLANQKLEQQKQKAENPPK